MIRRSLYLLLAVVAVSATPASAQSLTGTWQVVSEGRRGSLTQTLTLQQQGATLTGTLRFTGGGPRGRGGGGAALEISDGTVDGDSFTFTVTFELGGRGSISTSYSGTFDGDSMEGTIEGPRGGGQPFTGTRGG